MVLCVLLIEERCSRVLQLQITADFVCRFQKDGILGVQDGRKDDGTFDVFWLAKEIHDVGEELYVTSQREIAIIG